MTAPKRNPATRPYLLVFIKGLEHIKDDSRHSREALAISRNATYLDEKEKATLEDILSCFGSIEAKLQEFHEHFKGVLSTM